MAPRNRRHTERRHQRPGAVLQKVGGGTLALTGDNSYSGGTLVNEGRLLVNNTAGSGTGSGTVTVNAGTLGGTGSIGGAVVVNSGAHIAPGASIESLDVASITLSSGSILDFELGAPAPATCSTSQPPTA